MGSALHLNLKMRLMLGSLNEWTLEVAKIAHRNDGKNCGPNACWWGLRIQELDGNVGDAINAQSNQPAPCPNVTREHLFNMFTGKTESMKVVPSSVPGASNTEGLLVEDCVFLASPLSSGDVVVDDAAVAVATSHEAPHFPSSTSTEEGHRSIKKRRSSHPSDFAAAERNLPAPGTLPIVTSLVRIAPQIAQRPLPQPQPHPSAVPTTVLNAEAL